MKNTKKNNKKDIFINEIKSLIPNYIIGTIFYIIVVYIYILIPTIVGNILDMLIIGNVKNEIIMEEVYKLIFISLVLLIPRAIYLYFFYRLSRVTEIKLRSKVIHHLRYVKPEYFDKQEKNVFLAYLSKELVAIRSFLGNGVFFAMRTIVTFVMVIIMIIFNLNILLAIPLIIIIPLSLIKLYKLYKEQIQTVDKSRKVHLQLSKVIEKNTSGFSLIKLYNEQDNQKIEFDKVNRNRYKAEYEVGEIQNKINNHTKILEATIYIIAFTIGLILIYNSMLTVGELTAYIAYIGMILSKISASTSTVINSMANFKQSKKRYEYFFGLNEYKRKGKEIENIEKIEIKNLSYTYTTNCKQNVLEDINLTIKKGEKIGILGTVGSGKTTLMNIISGFYQVPKDKIYINDIDINKYSRESIFQNIGYTTQKTVILDDSVKNNIDIKEDNSADNINDIVKKADIFQDIEHMEDGLETDVGENGNKISIGQKQRIQIARSLLNIREVNIFDDTLSGLDVSTEKKVIDQIINQTKDKALILISNKTSMMEKMDKIYILVDGKIVDQGSHKKLLRKNKLYRELDAYEKAGDLI